MLAGPQSVGAEIDALASGEVRFQIADFHPIAPSAVTLDPVIGIGNSGKIVTKYLHRLQYGPQLSAGDLLLVGSTPIVKIGDPRQVYVPRLFFDAACGSFLTLYLSGCH